MPPANPVSRPPLTCDKCRTVLPETVFNTTEPATCPGCYSALLVEVFPAYFRPVATGQAAENIVSDEDASCFYHPAKKATVPCARCGRFLCALCDIDLGANRHVCPGCVEAARLDPAGKADLAGTGTGGGLPGATLGALSVQRGVLYDQLALVLTVLPLVILWPVSFITAPVALFLAIRYWNAPKRAVIPRGRGRMFAAALLATLEIGAWLTFAVYLYTRRTHGLE